MKYLKLFEQFDDPFGEEFPTSTTEPIELIKRRNRGEELTSTQAYVVHKYLYRTDAVYRKAWEEAVDNLFARNRSNIDMHESLLESVKFVKQTKKKDAKTDVYNVTKSGTVIGQVKWSSRMRGYAFLPTTDCDVEVKEFVKDLMAKRRAEKKKTK